MIKMATLHVDKMDISMKNYFNLISKIKTKILIPNK